MPDVEHLPDANPEITSNQEQPPEYARRLKDFAYAVDDLVQGHGKDIFSERVKQFVTDRKSAPCRPDLPLLRMCESNESPTAKTLPEEYAILSAIHDVLCPEAEPIDPFQKMSADDAKSREEYVAARKAEMAGAAYWALMADVEAVCRDMAEVAENGPPSARELADDLFRELERIRKSVEADLRLRAEVENQNGRANGGEGCGADAPPLSPRVAVDETDLRILQEMAANPDRCFKALEVRCVSEKTAKKRLKELLRMGLVENAKGERKGRKITSAGMALVNKVRPAKASDETSAGT